MCCCGWLAPAADVLEGSVVTDVVFVLVTLAGFALMGLLAKAVEKL